MGLVIKTVPIHFIAFVTVFINVMTATVNTILTFEAGFQFHKGLTSDGFGLDGLTNFNAI
jgi:hypothetical protein